MMILIADVLTAEELATVRARAADGPWTDGKSTAGWHARLVKDNAQMAAGPALDAVRATVIAALARSAVFQSAALPRRIGRALVSRYAGGQTYGPHVDDALMGQGGDRLRADLASTLFLSPPDAYDGGELVVSSPAGDTPIKLPAGAMALYPATTLHHVAPVTRGERLAAVFWTQSHVRDPAEREVLFDLSRTQKMMFDKDGKTPAFDLVSKTLANLIRRWAEA